MYVGSEIILQSSKWLMVNEKWNCKNSFWSGKHKNVYFSSFVSVSFFLDLTLATVFKTAWKKTKKRKGKFQMRFMLENHNIGRVYKPRKLVDGQKGDADLGNHATNLKCHHNDLVVQASPKTWIFPAGHLGKICTHYHHV